MEAALRVSLHGVGLLGALRQSLLATLALSLVIRVLKKPPSHPPARRAETRLHQVSFSRHSGALSITGRQSR